MTLACDGEDVFGFYESTTGSTGKYPVAGRRLVCASSSHAGQPVALAISWRSVADGPPDQTWNWASSLGGQISIADGEEVLLLNHLLVASNPFPELCARGVYCDKLTYRRVSGDLAPAVSRVGCLEAGRDALAGAWTANDGTALELQVRLEQGGRFGLVSGALALEFMTLDVIGFTDSNAGAANLDLQSVALSAVDRARNETITLGGWVNYESKVLSLQSLTHRATAPDSTYLQSSIRPLQLRRVLYLQ